MSVTTITKAIIAENISKHIGFSAQESNNIVNSIISIMVKSLAKGEDLLLTNFGKFEVKRKSSRLGRNPKTKVEFPISARNIVRFVISKKLKENINN